MRGKARLVLRDQTRIGCRSRHKDTHWVTEPGRDGKQYPERRWFEGWIEQVNKLPETPAGKTNAFSLHFGMHPNL